MHVLSRTSSCAYSVAVIAVLFFSEIAEAGRLIHSHEFSKRTYKYGESVPISCLNRTLDAGEHVTDSSGKLQYIPFPTCNETSQPLSFRYGIPETVTCTIDSLPDELYHLFEYYVHSDAPLTCRMPTVPLLEPSKHSDPTATSQGSHDAFMDGGAPAPFTPLTIALQGTLQKSHLHIWSDLNVLIHKSVDGDKKKGKKGKKAPGQIVAGTAYSTPWTKEGNKEATKSKKELGGLSIPWDPWKAGEGVKVLRGEPLSFKFQIGWVGESDIHTLSPKDSLTFSGILYNMVLFGMAGCFGGILVVLWDHLRRRRGGLWNGDGLLGHSSGQGGFFGRKGHGVSINLGTGGKTNGYGGYGFSGKNGPSQGYGGYSSSSGKRD